MPIKNRKGKTTYSFAIKKGTKYKPMPKYSKKRQRDIILGKVKLPKLYVVQKRNKKVLKARRVG